jgi:NTP pyrophosphatase (non-canonical NTP hydrolase)
MPELDGKYAPMVGFLVKPGEVILEELSPQDVHLIHMAIGASGEAGELLDAIKRHTIYRKPIDLDNVIEELGDMEFYMEGLRSALGITREQTLKANMEKLSKRYKQLRYSDKAAQDRADKQEQQA